MRIIVIPTNVIYDRYPIRYKLRKILSYFKLVRPPKFNLNGELNHYGELTRLIGATDVHVPVKLKDIYFNDNIYSYRDNALIENYPSNFNFIKPTYTSVESLKSRIAQFDAVIFSLQADEVFVDLVRLAKSSGVKVIFFDKKDHNQVYFNSKEDIYRGFKYLAPDFYLKQDVPLDNIDDKIVAICPVPCKPADKTPFREEKRYTFSFIGDFKPGVTLPDRKLILDWLGSKFDDTYIRYSSDKSHFHTFSEMNNVYNDTKILVSPSGIVWDSYRHADFIRYNSPILLPRPNTRTAPGDFIDMENCILYDVEYKDINRAIIKNKEDLFDKLSYVLDNPDVQRRIRESYFDMIHSFHTRVKRSEYILSLIK